MELKEYFENIKGLGVMSTADGNGNVNAAVYSRPHFMKDGSLAFIMRDRLTHENIRSNPHASFLFKEDGAGYKGKRLYLTKIREEENIALIESLARRSYLADQESKESRFLVFFKLDKERPLMGDE
jgi:pyridoxamine 5'-phosphate oxidase-like protein